MVYIIAQDKKPITQTTIVEGNKFEELKRKTKNFVKCRGCGKWFLPPWFLVPQSNYEVCYDCWADEMARWGRRPGFITYREKEKIKKYGPQYYQKHGGF